MKHGTGVNNVLVVCWGSCLKVKVQFMSKLLAVQDHIQTSVHSSITPKVSSCGSAPGDGRLLGFAGQKMNAKLGLVFSYL